MGRSRLELSVIVVPQISTKQNHSTIQCVYDPPPSSTGGRPHSRSNSPQPRPLASGFYFRKRTERLDWRMLASIHVERLQREVDVETLQRVIENITFCDVESEDLRYVDPNFIKLFQLSQLIIEYLLHSQDYLSDHREKLVEECDILARDLESLRAVHEREDSEVKNLRKENRALRKTIYAYQLMVKVPTSTNGGGPVTVSSYHRCHLCPKVFKSEVYLDHHLLRRHPGAQKEAILPSTSTTSRPTQTCR
ncbi:Iguana/Dzip1-like DAZ-interacting protein N-terminal-domain-containing protein [Chytridium lagenaria]|nr:Iguana/Dzip1-like DAZ-interacting protein N-terminal-domain-containing protein [Chytridium lagenaria]